jgi:hypothetical protein
VGFDYPTLRKEREGWGTRRLVTGIEPVGSLGEALLKDAVTTPAGCPIDGTPELEEGGLPTRQGVGRVR